MTAQGVPEAASASAHRGWEGSRLTWHVRTAERKGVQGMTLSPHAEPAPLPEKSAPPVQILIHVNRPNCPILPTLLIFIS